MKLHIALNDLGPEGLEINVDDPAIWEKPCGEFRIPVQVVEPLKARVFLSRQEGGCLVQGSIKGKVSIVCDRCVEPALVEVEQSFDEFEPYPAAVAERHHKYPGTEQGEGTLDTQLIFFDKNCPVLDLGGLLWEEFALALPVKPLCSTACKGICPECGTNFNRESCDCSRDEGDPRMAALRELSKKKAAQADKS